MNKTENKYQGELIRKIKTEYPDAIVLKNDANYIQGIPDLSIFKGKSWAMLEVKRSENESHRPNQDYYVEKANDMSFSAFIYPENEKEVLEQLRLFFAKN